jgi:hypothetical protein
MSDYAKPGCIANNTPHACAGVHCQVGWIEEERSLEPVRIDLRPYARTIIASALALAAGLYRGGQAGMTQDQDDPHRVLEDCIKGKGPEAAYAVYAGLDPAAILTDSRSKADFTVAGRNVDVKYAKRVGGPGGTLRFALAKGTWDRIKHDPLYELVAVTVDGWDALILGKANTHWIRQAMEAGLIPVHAPKGRSGGSPWYEVRVGLLSPMEE